MTADRKFQAKVLAVYILVCVAVMALLVSVTSCSKAEAAISTGQVVAAPALPLPGFCGDSQYAVVRTAALPRLYENFTGVLFKQGLVKWDERYDCNHFAALLVALSQAQYTVAAWHSSTPAQTLALAEYWYKPAGKAQGHAIVAIVTERGLVFMEPQTGQLLTLSVEERRTAYLVKW